MIEITLDIDRHDTGLHESIGSDRAPASAGRSGGAQRCSGDAGATIVEAAIYTPLLMLVLFGILEFSLAFRSYLTVSNGTRDASRMASVMGDSGDADLRILDDIEIAMAAVPDESIQRIVIWRADGPADEVPVGCAAGTPTSGGSSPCNVYTAADFGREADEFGCISAAPDRFWCPTDRASALSDPPDYVGIWIQVEHDYVTGLFGASRTIADQTIMRIEPQGLT